MRTASRSTLESLIAIGLGIWAVALIGTYYLSSSGVMICAPTNPGCIFEFGVLETIRDLMMTSRLWAALICAGIFGGVVYSQRRRVITLRISPLIAIIVSALALFVAMNLIVLTHTTMADVSFVALQVSLLSKLLLFYVSGGTISIVAIAIGIWVARKCGLRLTHGLSDTMIALGIGIVLISTLCFILLAFEILNVVSAPLLLGALVLISISDVVSLLTHIRSHRHEIEWHPRSLTSFAWFALLLAAAYAIHAGAMPFPFNWDGQYRYMNTVQLIAQGGDPVIAVFPYPFELIMSLGVLVFHSSLVAIALSWIALVWAAFALFVLCRRFADHRISTAVVASFVLMPVLAMMIAQVKVDFASTLFALLAVISMLHARTHLTTRTAWPWLAFAGLFVGYAVSIKLTTAFFAVGFGAWVAYEIIRSTATRSRTKALMLIAVASTAVLPFVPWVAYNISQTTHTPTIATLLQGEDVGPDVGVCSVRDAEHYLGKQEAAPVTFTGPREDFGITEGFGPKNIWWYLGLPLRVTAPTLYDIGQLGSMGLLPLLMLPIVLIAAMRRTNTDARLGILVLVGGVLWAINARAILWYGLPVLATYFVLIAAAWHRLRDDRISARYTTIAAVVALCAGMLFYSTMRMTKHNYYYLGSKFHDEHLAQYGWYDDRIKGQTVSDYPRSAADPAYAYSMHDGAVYWIQDNDRVLYGDPLYDSMNCILELHQDDPAATVAYLRDHGFRFVMADFSIVSVDMSPEQTLPAKASRVQLFLDRAVVSGDLQLLREAARVSVPYLDMYFIPVGPSESQ